MRKIYCDGACVPNPGWMGVGVYIQEGAKEELAYSASHGNGTNQQAELIALTIALEHARDGDEIFTDSQYAIGMAGDWKVKLNRELVSALRKAKRSKNVVITWVRGHDGDPGNERADELANQAAKPVSQKWTDEPLLPLEPERPYSAESGHVSAALIGPCPIIGGEDIWIARDRNFKSGDENAVYYEEELPLLAAKSPAELLEIHKVKKVFPGSVVRK